MILVRDVFRLSFGRAKDARALLKEGLRIAEKAGFPLDRALTDVTGPFYTLVLESTHPSLATWESASSKAMKEKEWGAWYERLKPLVDSGHREIFTVFDER